MASDRRARLLPTNETMNPFAIDPIMEPMQLIDITHESSSFDIRFGFSIEVSLGTCCVIHARIIPDDNAVKLAIWIE